MVERNEVNTDISLRHYWKKQSEDETANGNRIGHCCINRGPAAASVPVILVLGQGVVVMVMDPLLFQGQSLDLQLCALGLLHGLELMGCRHGTSEGGRLGQVTERSTCKKKKKEERGGAGGDTEGKWRNNGAKRVPRSIIVIIFKESLQKLSALISF